MKISGKDLDSGVDRGGLHVVFRGALRERIGKAMNILEEALDGKGNFVKGKEQETNQDYADYYIKQYRIFKRKMYLLDNMTPDRELKEYNRLVVEIRQAGVNRELVGVVMENRFIGLQLLKNCLLIWIKPGGRCGLDGQVFILGHHVRNVGKEEPAKEYGPLDGPFVVTGDNRPCGN